MSPIVYCISEGLASDAEFVGSKRQIIARIENAAASGVTHFQIREKKLCAANLFELAAAAATAANDTGVTLLVNDRLDIALAAGAHGIHLPANGLPVAEVRGAAPDGFVIAVSTHSVEEATAAKDAGASLAVFGPVYPSPGKGSGVGANALAVVCRTVAPFPIVALGGIEANRVNEVLRSGAAGFAAIRYLNACLGNGSHILGGASKI